MSGDRICVICGKEMGPIKNGFWFTNPQGEIRTSDLWGCKACKRFQIHGVPSAVAGTLHGILRQGYLITDPANDKYLAVIKPQLEFTGAFHDHLKAWYPDWKIRRKED